MIRTSMQTVLWSRPRAPRPFIGAMLAMSMSACAVGPDYVPPVPPPVDAFARQEAGAHHAPQPAAAEFWRSFGDPLLEKLVSAALAHNHDLRIALANYQQADALLGEARFNRLPTLTAGAQASDVRTASGDTSPEGDLYQASIGAIWELDFFGRIRRGVQAQRAQAEASAADLAAMQVAVVAELAHTYFEMRGMQERLRIARRNAQSQARTQELLQLHYDSGYGSGFDVDRGRAQLESTYARLPALEAEVAVSTHRIAVLTGATPESLIGHLDAAGGLPSGAAPAVAAGTPADLLRRRPDVAAAERRLAAATARVGVATADLFPRFTLTGLIGTQALDAGTLFGRDSGTRLLMLGIDGSFLNVGRVRARIAAADAEVAARLAAYESTVMAALEETENALVRLSRIERELENLRRAAQASTRAAGVARARLDSGAIDVLDLLDAERAGLQAEDAYALGRLRHAQARVSLYRTLAGGWTAVQTENPAGAAPDG